MPVSSGPLSPTDPTQGGFRAEDVLANVQGTHAARLTWGAPANVPEVSVSPPPGTTDLVIDVTPTPGTIRYTQSLPVEGGMALCPPTGVLSVDALVTFVTADGGLHESFSATLQAHDATSATFSTGLSAATVAGTFRVQDTMAWDTTSLVLTATFDAAGARGNITYYASKTMATGPSTGEGFGLMAAVAVWVPAAADAGSPEQPDAAADGAVADAQGDGLPPD